MTGCQRYLTGICCIITFDALERSGWGCCCGSPNGVAWLSHTGGRPGRWFLWLCCACGTRDPCGGQCCMVAVWVIQTSWGRGSGSGLWPVVGQASEGYRDAGRGRCGGQQRSRSRGLHALLVLLPPCGWLATPMLPPTPRCGGSLRFGTGSPWWGGSPVRGAGRPLPVSSHPGGGSMSPNTS